MNSFYIARDATVQKIETIIKEQFSIEMKNKEHEIQVIDQVYKYHVYYKLRNRSRNLCSHFLNGFSF